MREISDLLTLCRYGGSSLALGQGAGGNASVKSPAGDVMWIKASGYRLSAVSEGTGYLRMRVPSVARLGREVEGLESDAADRAASSFVRSLTLDSTKLRPSMETWFHFVLGKIVLHTHPIYANAFSCMEGGDEALDSLLPTRAAFVEYQTPGYFLGRAVQRQADIHRSAFGTEPLQTLLANHGLITAGETVNQAIAATDAVLDAGLRFFGPIGQESFAQAAPASDIVAWAAELQRAFTRHTGQSAVARAARFRVLQSMGRDLPVPLVPDDVVCNGESPNMTKTGESAADFIERSAGMLRFSTAIAIPDKGFVFLAPGSGMIDAMEEQLLANVVLRKLIRRKGQCRSLTSREISPLLSMEQEKHRQSVLAEVKGELQCKS